MGSNVLPHFGHHLGVPGVDGGLGVVAVVVFVVVNNEGHPVLGGPFFKGVEDFEQVLVVVGEGGRIGSVCNEGVAVGGVQVKVDGQTQGVDAVLGHQFYVVLVKLEFSLEYGSVFFEPVGNVDTLVQVLHCLGLERVGNGYVTNGDFRNDRILDFHVSSILFHFARVLQVDVIDKQGIHLLVSLGLETDVGDVGWVEIDFYTAPTFLGEILEADNRLGPGAGSLHGHHVDIVIGYVGSFDANGMSTTLVPVSESTVFSVIHFGIQGHAPADIRIKLVFALVKCVVDGPSVVGAVVGLSCDRESVCADGTLDFGGTVAICAAVVVIIVVPVEFTLQGHIVAVFEVINQETLAFFLGNGDCGYDVSGFRRYDNLACGVGDGVYRCSSGVCRGGCRVGGSGCRSVSWHRCLCRVCDIC